MVLETLGRSSNFILNADDLQTDPLALRGTDFSYQLLQPHLILHLIEYVAHIVPMSIHEMSE